MKNLRIIGSVNRGSGSASYRDDGTHNGHKLLPCPFCGSNEQEVQNTHSAAYWIECECGVQKYGENFVDEAEEAETEAELLSAHEQAFMAAVNGWNERAS